MLFDDTAKEFLRDQLWKVAAFSGVTILTYCLMDNHFHVLIEIEEGEPPADDSELLRRYRALYPNGDARHRLGIPEVLAKRLAAGGEESAQIRQGLQRRMGDVSTFMGLLKQRFSVWYNHTRHRFGTLWADRFKSVLVEGGSESMGSIGSAWLTVACYIDLNPVRAGLTRQPESYRWCGIGDAAGGHRGAQHGISRLFGCAWKQAWPAYRERLYGAGSAPRERGAKINPQASGAATDKSEAMDRFEAMLRKVRHYTDGLALGSRSFVEEQWSRYAALTKRRRKGRARPWSGNIDSPAEAGVYSIGGQRRGEN